MNYDLGETILNREDLILLFERVDEELRHIVESNTGNMLKKMFACYKGGKSFVPEVREIKRFEGHKGFRFYKVENYDQDSDDPMFPQGTAFEELSLYNVKNSEIKSIVSRKKNDKDRFGFRILDDTQIIIFLKVEGYKKNLRLEFTFKQFKLELSRLLLGG